MDLYGADWHFFHSKVIEYEKRPFSSVNNMNQGLVSRWNKKVKDYDDVWIVGDFAFNKHWEKVRELVMSLNGRKHLILGNHDDRFREWTWMRCGFSSVHTILYHHDKFLGRCLLCHKPEHIAEYVDENPQCIVLHGHYHARRPRITHGKGGFVQYNVGVDVNDFEPKSGEEIRHVLYEYQQSLDSYHECMKDSL